MRFQTNRRGCLRAAAALGMVAAAVPLLRAQGPDRVIPIVARKFEFEPASIDVRIGEAVVLEFTSLDVLMGFNLPAFKLRTDVVPGQKTSLRLVPDRVGRFGFRCDVFCGDGHEDMDGTLIVTA
jgi:cytochrome c oxidase subunit II